MPYRPRFDCLWCGDAWTCRGPDDLEGWAQLCPTCLGRAGTNHFLKMRLRGALAERGAGGVESEAVTRPPSRPARPAPALPDDWFFRRGAFERGAIHDTAWAAELDVVTRWLDAQPLRGRLLEPAAGVGFFSPLLAERGELHAADPDGAALDTARARLVAHGLVAHLHEADPWARPAPGEPPFDAVVAAFLVGRVRGAGLDPSASWLRARLRAGGSLAVIDLRPDPAGGPPPGVAWTYHDPEVLEAAFARAGFTGITLASTGRFFVTLAATAS
jgi:SAM-dependent methyltransferase